MTKRTMAFLVCWSVTVLAVTWLDHHYRPPWPSPFQFSDAAHLEPPETALLRLEVEGICSRDKPSDHVLYWVCVMPNSSEHAP